MRDPITRGRRVPSPRRTTALLVAVALTVAGCSTPADTPTDEIRGPEAGLPSTTAGPEATVDVVAVGDIVCSSDLEVTDTECQQQATADLASSLDPDAVVALGDLQYTEGLYDEFLKSWAPSWGQFDDIIAPVPGNHEYETEGAAGYARYFDTGPYYVREIGAWRFYLLDSNCDQIDCDEEARWLADDLAANPTTCTAIAMHHPRWSSGVEHGSQEQVDGLWRAAVEGGVDLSLAAHEHDYERFAPIDADGNVTDPESGTTHFVVGTGGRSQYSIGDLQPGSEFAADQVFGVLDLKLRPDAFEWRFLDVDGEVLDKGGLDCF
ncbi:metallophosphoesterase family protein [Nocardioides salsibiostraticola]